MNRLWVIIFFFAPSAFADGICLDQGPASFACEALMSACRDQISAFQELYGEGEAREQYGSCPRDAASETSLTVKNCAIPGLFIAATFAKNLAIRAAAGGAGAVILGDVMNEALKADAQCFRDKAGKLRLRDEYNAKVQFVEAKLGAKLPKHLLDRPDEQISQMPCRDLRDLLVAKERVLAQEIGLNLRKLGPKALDEINQFNSAEVQLKKSGVDLACLRPSKKALILCEVASAAGPGVGIGVLAASKLARQVAFAQALADKAKTRLAFRKEKKLDSYIEDSVNFTYDEMSTLKYQAQRIFASNASSSEKMKEVSQLYFDARIAKLPPQKQAIARKALANVGRDAISRFDGQRIFLREGLDPSMVTYHRVLAHEFEHVLQTVSDKNKKAMADILKRLISAERPRVESSGSLSYRWELEAIGAQYDMIRLFPADLVRGEARSIHGLQAVKLNNGEISVANHVRHRLESALSMNRAEYIAFVRNSHGYNGRWAVEVDIEDYQAPILRTVMALSQVAAAEATSAVLFTEPPQK